MQLRAYAKPGEPVRQPGNSIPIYGQPVRLVGMKFDYEKKEQVPSGKPCVCADTDDGARELVKAIRQGHLLPGDKDTADAAGVPFVELEVGEDNWAKPKAASAPARFSKKAEV